MCGLSHVENGWHAGASCRARREVVQEPSSHKATLRPKSSIAEGRNRHLQDRLWRLRRGAGVERGMRVIFDNELNALGQFGPGDIGGEREGKVYGGGDAGARPDSPGGG